MHDLLTDRSARPSRNSWAVWLLLAGALVQLAVRIAPDWYRLFGPYMLVDVEMVINWIRGVAPFLLAAAVVLGADRWPAGRRWLLFGAVALGAVGLLALGSDVWWALWEPSPGGVLNGEHVLLVGRSIAAATVFVAAHALLAAGLWAARPSRPAGARRRALMGVIGVAGMVALVADLWAVSVWLPAVEPTMPMHVSITFGLLTALGAPAMAALASAALRGMPSRGGLPEVLVAMGAMLALGGLTWEFVFPSAVPLLDLAPEQFVWVFTVPSVIIALGMVTMIAGFGGAALANRRRTADDPTT